MGFPILPSEPPCETEWILDPVLNPVRIAVILVRSIRKREGLA